MRIRTDGEIKNNRMRFTWWTLLVFDAATCAHWQSKSDKDSIQIPIDYIVSD